MKVHNKKGNLIMGIEATSSSVSAASVTQNSPSQSTSKANTSDSSFKEEMNKVSDSKTAEKNSDGESDKLKNNNKSEVKDKSLSSDNNKGDKISSDFNNNNNNNEKMQSLSSVNGQFLINDANLMLSNDIQQMIENTISLNGVNLKSWMISVGENKQPSLQINESDADFFINLSQTDNVNIQGITAQAQNMINNGAEISDVKQNMQVSQALLNALSEARENNQPIRIDFDQNISVILRVGRDGAISAQFIPGDKAVEQYLRNNIESLKSSFDEQDLPYSELSYSNSSKEQNQRRRQEKQQGE